MCGEDNIVLRFGDGGQAGRNLCCRAVEGEGLEEGPVRLPEAELKANVALYVAEECRM